VATAATGLIACGSGDDKSGGGDKTKAADKAFLTGMNAHHQSALEMAAIANTRGEDPFVKRLAGDITSTQNREIVEMKGIYKRLFNGELRPDPGAHDGLGLTAEQAGMTHSPKTNEMLRSANPFDRAFVDEMVPHHRGAVTMATTVLTSSKDGPLRKLAEGIITTQKREITEMNDFRTKKFGGPVPAGAGHSMKSSGGKPEGEMKHGAGHSG